MKRLGQILLLVALTPMLASAAEATGGGKHAGWRYIPGYRPKNLTSFDEVPAEIRQQVITHLKDRVGGDFFSRLEFAGGQAVDFDEMIRANPRQRGRDDIPKYDLHFRFVRGELGITEYEAQIKLRADGSVLEEINLPGFRLHPEKLTLLAFSVIKSIAISNGWTGPVEGAEMDYAKTTDSLFWRLTRKTSDDGLVMRYQHVEISAHDGAVLRKYESEAIR